MYGYIQKASLRNQLESSGYAHFARETKATLSNFLEWKSYDVAITVLTPWMISCLVGVLWAPVGGDDQTAFKSVGIIRASSSRPARVRSIYVIFFGIMLTTRRASKVMQTLLIYR
jgi:hypothetical protein